MPFRSKYQDRLNRDLEFLELGEEVILRRGKRAVIIKIINEAEEEEARRNNRKRKVRKAVPDIAKRYTDEVKEKLITDIIDITEDESLGNNKGTLRSLVYSKGGAKDKNANLNRKEADDMKFNGRRSAYLAILINGILTLEAVGQANNATYVGRYKGEETLDALRKYTRTEIVEKDIMYKILHEKTPIPGVYDYESNHLRTILQAAVDNPKELLDVLEAHKQKGHKSAVITTIQANMAEKVSQAKKAAKQIVMQKGFSAQDVVKSGLTVFEEPKKATELKQEEKPKPRIIKPTKRVKKDEEQPSGR